MGEEGLNKFAVESHEKDEGSDDDKPLSIILSGELSKKASNSIPEGSSSPTPNSSHSKVAEVSSMISSDDSEDDDLPLALKYQLKVRGGARSSSSTQSQKIKVSVKKSSSDDSEDEIPIGLRFQMKARVRESPNSNPTRLPKAELIMKKSCDDSDDDAPTSSEHQLKTNTGPGSSKSNGFKKKRPLDSTIQAVATSKNGNQQKKSPKSLKKRPPSEDDILDNSSVKKLKKSDGSGQKKVKKAAVKAETVTDDEEDYSPMAKRMKKSVSSKTKLVSLKKTRSKPLSSYKKKAKKSKKFARGLKYCESTKMSPSSGEGKKWTTLLHNGVIFPPPHKPHGVKMLYGGHAVDLTPDQEEVATMFAVMKDTDYATKPRFVQNFMNDWRPILGKKHIIKKFELCDFTPIYEWHQKEKEKKKQMSNEEKKALKEEKSRLEEKYMWAVVDGVKEKVGNFRVEPPALFRGRGEHPKMGKLKKRIYPRDITINIGKGAPIPECPIPGERWKEVRHDNTVTWLAYWTDPINTKEFKYVFLAASSSLKGQSDKEKYEKARMLKDYIQNIRATYTKDFTSNDIMKQQIAVATYLIDKLALRAGNEKDDDEADTVGCCTLKVENVTLIPPHNLQFDFLGKDSVKYFNTVEVEIPVYNAIGKFKAGKSDGDDIFDKLDTNKLNAHLKELMPGLTAKVFRTYNASITLDEMLNEETKAVDVAVKVVTYQKANKEVAILCNHQRSESKSHSAQMTRLNEKMEELKGVLDGLKTDLARTRKGKPLLGDANGMPRKNMAPEALEKKIAQTSLKMMKMERDMKTKEDLKTVALGTSKINYLDPRISVAWCKRQEVPIEKIFNRSLLAKFAWAMDVEPGFRF